jgi:hypothetical protein
MNRRLLLLLTTMIASCSDTTAFSTVTYRGEIIPLSRTYLDFHEYRDDPNNLPREVHQKVAQLVRAAPVASQYPSRKAASGSLSHLKFPGYGYSLLGLDKPVALYSLEVPMAEEQRYLTFVERGGAWVLVDDFIWPNASGYIQWAEVQDERVRYYDEQKKMLREH